jgi:hypothetical protein
MSEAILRGFVQQDAYHVAKEQGTTAVRLNPRGELVSPDWYTQLVLDGRVYNVSNEVQETGALLGEAGGPGTNNVAPSMLLDVPSGTTVIPLSLAMMPQDSVGTSGDWLTIRMNTESTKTHYSSGGNQITPKNMRKDDPNTSACSFYEAGTAIVALANVDDDTIWHTSYDTSTRDNERLAWSAREDIPPVLIGPASLMVFVETNNVDEGVFFSFKYAEFSTTDVT